MYRGYDYENGVRPTVYRSPNEVREDVKYIKERIKEATSSINLRQMLLDILSDERLCNSEKLMSALSDALGEAREAQNELRELEEELVLLEDELREVRWIAGC